MLGERTVGSCSPCALDADPSLCTHPDSWHTYLVPAPRFGYGRRATSHLCGLLPCWPAPPLQYPLVGVFLAPGLPILSSPQQSLAQVPWRTLLLTPSELDPALPARMMPTLDRKSTRLNSSH